MHPLVTILLSLAGWSAGAAAWTKRKLPVPCAFDLLGVPILCCLQFLLPGYEPGHLMSASVSLASGFLLGSLSGRAFGNRYPAARRESREAAAGGPARKALAAWKGFAHRMGGFQGRMLLGFFYYSVFAPFGLLLRLSGNPMGNRSPETGWAPRPQTSRSGDECLRQF